VLADKAYSSRANRVYLRRRGIRAVIPVKADQLVRRRGRGSRGDRPPAFDPAIYRKRHAVERVKRQANSQVLSWPSSMWTAATNFRAKVCHKSSALTMTRDQPRKRVAQDDG
jgi:transposase